MGFFLKQEIDEVMIRDFWDWFKNNSSSNILEIVKEATLRLQKISNGGQNGGWYEMGYDLSKNKGTITFWADGSRYQRNCFKKLAESAPDDIMEKWILRVEN